MKTNLHINVTDFEIRKNTDGQNVIRGLAIPYNRDSLPIYGYFIERFLPGSVENLGDDSEVFAYVEHDSSKVLARRSEKSLVLIDSAEGMYAETVLNNTTYALDLLENIRTKVIRGMSFSFRCQVEEWDDRPKMPIRTVKKCNIGEVTYTHNPAYPDTTAKLRGNYFDREELLQLAKVHTKVEVAEPTIVDLMKIRGV